jgi:hypothetical protein
MRKLLFVAAVVASGCGGGIAAEDLGTELQDAFCDRYVRCGVVASYADCQLLFDGSFGSSIDELLAGIDNGTIRYDEDAAQECIDAFRDASCDETTREARVESPACLDAIRGTIPDGGGCAISAQCASGDCERMACPDACCPGTCGPTRFEAPIGGPCSIDIDCAAGGYCSGTTCAALLAIDQPCTADDECDYGLYCTDAGACADAPNQGDACPDGSCADIGNSCADATMTCVPLGGLGASCGLASGVGCQALYICDDTTNTCSERPGVGETCTFACAPGAYCDFGTQSCVADQPDGAPCLGGNECASGYCDDAGVCGPEPQCL